MAQQIRVESDRLIERRILINGERIAVENMDQPIDDDLGALAVFEGPGDIGRDLTPEKQFIGQIEEIVALLGEVIHATINESVALLLCGRINIVEALEEAAVEKGDGGKQALESRGISEEFFVTIKGGYAAIAVSVPLVFFAKTALTHLLIQRGEK